MRKKVGERSGEKKESGFVCIKNDKDVEFKTLNNEVLQETNLARLYDDMSKKIVKESEDFEGRDSGWTLDEILRLEVRTNRYSPFRGSSSFIEVPNLLGLKIT
ncbi:hypothetical protein TNCV_4529451 [Trichonephila clavipes]|nr:hypothetical protein TNCV_4529451 [Trichonephila clavipes]